MATDRVKVYTAGMRKTSHDVGTAQEKFQALQSRLEAANAAHFGKWGDDDFGKTFYGGENGYETSYKNLHDNLKSKVDLLQQYKQGLSDSADAIDKMDQGNRDDIASV